MTDLHFDARAILATYLDFAAVVPGGKSALARELALLGNERVSRRDRKLLAGFASGRDTSFKSRYQQRFALEQAAKALAADLGEVPVYALFLRTLFGVGEGLALNGAGLLAAGVHPARVEALVRGLPPESSLSEGDVRFVLETAELGLHAPNVAQTLVLVEEAGLDEGAAEVAHRLVLDGLPPAEAVSAATSLVCC